MNYFDLIYQKREAIGKILLIISVLILLYMFVNPINGVYINIDERFTVNLVNLPFKAMYHQMAGDVHPPLYYLFLVPLAHIFNVGDKIFPYKVVSIIPYMIILILANTKLLKEYGYFTAGLYTFSIATMSEFFLKFLTIRNYAWAILFLTLSFVYLKDVLTKGDKTSWILFTFFNLCCIYTHNILFISVGLMYLIILVHYFIGKREISIKSELKKWLISAVTLGILYLPWIRILLSQVDEKQGNSLETFGLQEFFNCFISYASRSYDLILYVLAIILFILVLVFAIKMYRKDKNDYNYYIISGVGLFVLTLIIGSSILPMLFAPIAVRYLLPTYAVFVLTIAILTGKLDNKKFVSILFILIILIGCINFVSIIKSSDVKYGEGVHELETIDKINNKNSIVLFNESFLYMCYNYDFDKTKVMGLKKLPIDYEGNYTIETNLTKILKDNPDKDVYFFKTVRNSSDADIGDNFKTKKVKVFGNYHYIKLDLKNKTS